MPLLLVIIVVYKLMCSLNKFFLFKHGMYDLIYYLNGEASLVHRGNCTFTTKVKVAHGACVVAILVVNDK